MGEPSDPASADPDFGEPAGPAAGAECGDPGEVPDAPA
jgi:hypothetical protein